MSRCHEKAGAVHCSCTVEAPVKIDIAIDFWPWPPSSPRFCSRIKWLDRHIELKFYKFPCYDTDVGLPIVREDSDRGRLLFIGAHVNIDGWTTL